MRLLCLRGSVLGRVCLSSSSSRAASRRMQQVDVEREEVRADLGRLKVNLVRQAEQQNLERASKYRVFRKRDALSALALASLVFGIYSYTMYAVRQEDFLDDFDRPDPQIEVEQQILAMQEREQAQEK